MGWKSFTTSCREAESSEQERKRRSAVCCVPVSGEDERSADEPRYEEAALTARMVKQRMPKEIWRTPRNLARSM